MQELNKLETLRDIIDKGEYIVALCGSGMMEECGIHPLKDQDRAYRIEERYGRSPEYLYTDAFFNTRTETFYDFYRNELLVDWSLRLRPIPWRPWSGREAQVHYLK